jgi:hypothetical protein
MGTGDFIREIYAYPVALHLTMVMFEAILCIYSGKYDRKKTAIGNRYTFLYCH